MGKSVLVVDDDKMLRDALSVGLTNAGFDVLRAESAEIAAEIISRINVDAIILDRMLGGMDGLTFLKKFRKNNKITPVIMLTALSGAQNTIDGLTDGADDYMAKPFQLQELILRLNNLLKKRVQTNEITKMPDGLIFAEDEFFVKTAENQSEKLLALSNEEKKLLQNLTNPVGNIVSATPMVAKRLRIKINSVLSNLDIITVRGMGYKIITTKR
jgi:DNA-binding response OmpR family regulator